ncbi:MAG: serine/threonine protein kinase [Polyangiaceae bacterium]|nr:serine/threonine protein kinase [Polyangiaceae bacterium]
MQPGDLVSGKYRLLRQLGRGGMGSVWAARNELTDRDFAIKFLLPELAQNRDALHRFFLEARACGQIKHPAVVAVYDMGQAEDGAPYLVMELMEGEGLDQRLERSGIFRPGEAAACVAYVARGLEEAHVRGLVHRDLKPGNIFFAIDDRGEVVPKVLDFGVTKATVLADPKFVRTNTGAVLGSPAYMSPEQARGDEDIDGRSDVWSLGVILYETLTGKIPYDGANYNQLMVSILMDKHRPAIELNPAIGEELNDLVESTLQKDRNKRVRTARELAERLESLCTRITGTPYPGFGARSRSMAPPPKPMPTPTETWVEVTPVRRRTSAAVWVSGAVFVAAVVGMGGIAIARTRPPVAEVASRSVSVLSEGRGRLVKELDRLKAAPPVEPSATPEGDKTEPATPVKNDEHVIEPDELPSAAPSAPAPRWTPGRVPPPKKNGQVHDGVTSPGF